MKLSDVKIAVVGLGYVGLPLAVEFGKYRQVLGFDINASRVEKLQLGVDDTRELSAEELKGSTHLSFSHEESALKGCNVFIVTVPTPIDDANQPDLTPIIKASECIGKIMQKNSIVIYESTVYPGCTEEICVPILERQSGLVFNHGFFCGYSPERINPGDREHRIGDIVKVTSGSTPEIATFVDSLYSEIIIAGTHQASSIRVAEAAKVIENVQRDVNIALINEFALIFNRLGIDTQEVLLAAGSKWNFLPFRPGLVGGHCIGVDPYYLTYKAQTIGYHPNIILAGRRINDEIPAYIATQLVKSMINADIQIRGASVLILGITFKENCPDIRNTKVMDVFNELNTYNCNVDLYDPWVKSEEVSEVYGVVPINEPSIDNYDAILLAVPHEEFLNLGPQAIRKLGKKNHVLYDLKSVFSKEDSDLRL
jgi:UDP-N-acetyl-D-galactosamine dehydrogenase